MMKDHEIVVDFVSSEFQLEMRGSGKEYHKALMLITIEDLERWPESSRSALQHFKQIDILKESDEAELVLFLLASYGGFIKPFIDSLVISLDGTEDWSIIKENFMEQEFVNSATVIMVNSLFLKDNWKKMTDKILAVLKSTVDESIDNHIAHVVGDLRNVINIPPVINYINDIIFDLKWTYINQQTNKDKWPLKLHDFYSESIEYLKTKHQFTPQTTPTPLSTKKKRGPRLEYTFESLFESKYAHHADKFIQILKDLEIINSNDRWLASKDKGIAKVFYEELIANDVLKNTIKPAAAGRAFESKFGGEIIDMFAKPPGVYANIYREPFSKKIKKLISEKKE